MKSDRFGVKYTLMCFTIFLCSIAVLARPSFAPTHETHTRASSATAVVAMLDRRLGDALPWISSPGASAAVIREGRLIEWQAGVTSAWLGAPVQADTQFEAASLSKPLTAYAVLRLARLGQLDLDAPITRAGQTFTLRQVLSHTAGFDNNLTASIEPRTAPGRFAYAGGGYLFLGEIIAQTTRQSFVEHMNSVLLPELGMTNSQFSARANASLALPSIDAGLPFALMLTIVVLVSAPLLTAYALAARIWRSGDRPEWAAVRHLIAAIAIGCGAFAVHWILGAHNWAALLPAGVMFALGAGAWLLAARPAVAARIGAIVCATAFLGLLIARPAAPLVERRADFLPAAGLRTTASDYARFLSHIVEGAHTDAYLARMLGPQARVNPNYDWGLGVGLQRGETESVWHWGVNFPGYQALAIANRETGDVAVVLLNGGRLNISPSGLRYSGLEAARAAIADVQGGKHSAYWQGVQ